MALRHVFIEVAHANIDVILLVPLDLTGHLLNQEDRRTQRRSRETRLRTLQKRRPVKHQALIANTREALKSQIDPAPEQVGTELALGEVVPNDLPRTLLATGEGCRRDGLDDAGRNRTGERTVDEVRFAGKQVLDLYAYEMTPTQGRISQPQLREPTIFESAIVVLRPLVADAESRFAFHAGEYAAPEYAFLDEQESSACEIKRLADMLASMEGDLSFHNSSD